IGHRTFIWDMKGIERQYLGTLDITCPVYYVNPIDKLEGVGIDLAGEITGPLEADAFAAEIISQYEGKIDGEDGSTFVKATRAILSEVIEAFNQVAPGNWCFMDVLEACQDERNLTRVLSLTRSGQAQIIGTLGANKQAKGVMITLEANCRTLKPLAAAM